MPATYLTYLIFLDLITATKTITMMMIIIGQNRR
jgi:hypothetical protein